MTADSAEPAIPAGVGRVANRRRSLVAHGRPAKQEARSRNSGKIPQRRPPLSGKPDGGCPGGRNGRFGETPRRSFRPEKALSGGRAIRSPQGEGWITRYVSSGRPGQMPTSDTSQIPRLGIAIQTHNTNEAAKACVWQYAETGRRCGRPRALSDLRWRRHRNAFSRECFEECRRSAWLSASAEAPARHLAVAFAPKRPWRLAAPSEGSSFAQGFGGQPPPPSVGGLDGAGVVSRVACQP
jgi:hypothetical protein